MWLRPLFDFSATTVGRNSLSDLVYIGGFSGRLDSQAVARFMLNRYGAARFVLVNSDAVGNDHPLTIEHIDRYRNSSLLSLCALMHRKHIQGSANRPWLLRIERELKAAFQAAERMLRLRVFLADHIDRQLVIRDELHSRRLPRSRQEISK